MALSTDFLEIVVFKSLILTLSLDFIRNHIKGNNWLECRNSIPDIEDFLYLCLIFCYYNFNFWKRKNVRKIGFCWITSTGSVNCTNNEDSHVCLFPFLTVLGNKTDFFSAGNSNAKERPCKIQTFFKKIMVAYFFDAAILCSWKLGRDLWPFLYGSSKNSWECIFVFHCDFSLYGKKTCYNENARIPHNFFAKNRNFIILSRYFTINYDIK